MEADPPSPPRPRAVNTGQPMGLFEFVSPTACPPKLSIKEPQPERLKKGDSILQITEGLPTVRKTTAFHSAATFSEAIEFPSGFRVSEGDGQAHRPMGLNEFLPQHWAPKGKKAAIPIFAIPIPAKKFLPISKDDSFDVSSSSSSDRKQVVDPLGYKRSLDDDLIKLPSIHLSRDNSEVDSKSASEITFQELLEFQLPSSSDSDRTKLISAKGPDTLQSAEKESIRGGDDRKGDKLKVERRRTGSNSKDNTPTLVSKSSNSMADVITHTLSPPTSHTNTISASPTSLPPNSVSALTTSSIPMSMSTPDPVVRVMNMATSSPSLSAKAKNPFINAKSQEHLVYRGSSRVSIGREKDLESSKSKKKEKKEKEKEKEKERKDDEGKKIKFSPGEKEKKRDHVEQCSWKKNSQEGKGQLRRSKEDVKEGAIFTASDYIPNQETPEQPKRNSGKFTIVMKPRRQTEDAETLKASEDVNEPSTYTSYFEKEKGEEESNSIAPRPLPSGDVKGRERGEERGERGKLKSMMAPSRQVSVTYSMEDLESILLDSNGKVIWDTLKFWVYQIYDRKPHGWLVSTLAVHFRDFSARLAFPLCL